MNEKTYKIRITWVDGSKTIDEFDNAHDALEFLLYWGTDSVFVTECVLLIDNESRLFADGEKVW